MRAILDNESFNGAMMSIKKVACNGLWDGILITPYFENCRWYLIKYNCTIIFTRDVNHHLGGWWKNPQYERCWHLSISFQQGERKKKILDAILKSLFGKDVNKIWIEPPYSYEGKKIDVWHYRLFCDKNWNPIIPKGEVYSKHFTEIGWKSFSELHNVK